ncbi:tail sheath [Escherichia phage phiSUSP1]|uniref:Putative structural protein n=1 Tax=Escherichia phage phiSUSP1 TaxID=1718606 RepID=A0A0N7GFM0_9CAUD|nr:tail sheath [Escherichia phage phiSUSP1]ALH47042.1 putative structural protein [Escherichia phage phiSUSP1]
MWNPIVNVDITLNTAGTTREGFGLPLFLASTDNFEERVRGYTSLTEVAEDFGEDTAAYKAAKQLWSQTPKVTQLYIGRRAMQYTVSIPDEVTESTDYSLTVAVGGGVSQPYQYTAQAEDTALIVLTQFKDQIEADPTIKDDVTINVTGTGSSATMIVTKAGDNDFVKVTSTTNTVSIAGTTADTAATALAAIETYSTDWYFISAEDRTAQFVLAMASEIQARKKIFFTANSDVAALQGTELASASDVPAQLAKSMYTRTVCLWHHTASYDYPEMAYVAYGAPYDAGSIAWGNAQLTGVEASLQPANQRPLTSIQKSALDVRHCNFIDLDGGVPVVRRGITSGGEWIDIIRGVDWLESDLKTSLRDLLINQKGGKITYDDTGITRIRQVIETSLQRAVNRNFLSSYTVNVPKASQVALADKKARILKDVTFAGILAGAILDVDLKGTVAYE